MRVAIAFMMMLASGGVMAQSNSITITSNPAPTLQDNETYTPQHASYMIAPGVSVTPLYKDAPSTMSSYSASDSSAAYSSQADNSASYAQPSYSRPLVSQPAPTHYEYPANQMSNTSQQAQATPYNNGAYRFNMQQNGQQMTADDFGRWMDARGIRVAGGKR